MFYEKSDLNLIKHYYLVILKILIHRLLQKELKTSNNVYYSNCENFQIDRLTSTLLHPLKNGPYESVDTLRQHWLQLWRSRLVLRNWSILEHSTSKQMWGRKKMAATAAVKLLTHGATVAPTIATLRQFQVGDSAWKSDSIFFLFLEKKIFEKLPVRFH